MRLVGIKHPVAGKAGFVAANKLGQNEHDNHEFRL
jgi:hypothetical protein